MRRVANVSPSDSQYRYANLESQDAIAPGLRDRIVFGSTVLGSGVTKTSHPDPALLRQYPYIEPNQRAAITTGISDNSITQDYSLEYTLRPMSSEAGTVVRCPYCFRPLDHGAGEEENNILWKRHVDKHLMSYECLFPECAESVAFFARRDQWKAHMESVHSKEWLRKVHVIVWYCDIDHEAPKIFETDLQWRTHMQDLKSHPTRKLEMPTQAQLDSMSSRKQHSTLRHNYVCPLCEQIPEKIRPLVEVGRGNPSEMYDAVVNHVGDHLKSLSLLALPSLASFTKDGKCASALSELMIEASFDRLLIDESKSRPASKTDALDEVSIDRHIITDKHTSLDLTNRDLEDNEHYHEASMSLASANQSKRLIAANPHEEHVSNFRQWMDKNVLYAVTRSGDGKGTAFVPIDDVQVYLTDQNDLMLKSILNELFHPEVSPDAPTILANFVAVFCILVELGHGADISYFIIRDWKDGHLPIEQDDSRFSSNYIEGFTKGSAAYR